MNCPNCGAPNVDTARYCVKCGKEMPVAAPPPVVPSAPTGKPLYAGFWRRVGAALIDSIPLLTIGVIVGFATDTHSMFWWNFDDSGGLRDFVLSALVGWLYFASLESSPIQASLGKLVVGLYVTDENGRRITFGQATGRHFGKYLSAILLLIGFLMAGFTPKKQALHDMLAGTLVMRH